MRSALTCGLSLVLIGILAGGAGGEAPRLYAASRTATPPSIDGDLSDSCWLGADWAQDFTCVLTRSGSPEAATRARFCFDEQNLYVGIKCAEPNMSALREQLSRGLGGKFADEVEIFLDENRDRSFYHQFMIDSDGSRYEGFRYDADWTCPWEAAVQLGEAGYLVEVAIPFASLGVAVPGPGEVWGMNLCRARSITEPIELSCWSDTGGGFHAPDRFGLLVFAPYREWLAEYFGRQALDLVGQMRLLCMRYPRSTTQIAEKIGRTDLYQAALPPNLATEAEARPWYEHGEETLADLLELCQEVRLAIIAGEFR